MCARAHPKSGRRKRTMKLRETALGGEPMKGERGRRKAASATTATHAKGTGQRPRDKGSRGCVARHQRPPPPNTHTPCSRRQPILQLVFFPSDSTPLFVASLILFLFSSSRTACSLRGFILQMFSQRALSLPPQVSSVSLRLQLFFAFPRSPLPFSASRFTPFPPH